MPTTPRRGKSVASTYESPAARCVSHRPRLALTIRDLRYVRPPRGSTRVGSTDAEASARGHASETRAFAGARAHTHTSNDDTPCPPPARAPPLYLPPRSTNAATPSPAV